MFAKPIRRRGAKLLEVYMYTSACHVRECALTYGRKLNVFSLFNTNSFACTNIFRTLKIFCRSGRNSWENYVSTDCRPTSLTRRQMEASYQSSISMPSHRRGVGGRSPASLPEAVACLRVAALKTIDRTKLTALRVERS